MKKYHFINYKTNSFIILIIYFLYLLILSFVKFINRKEIRLNKYQSKNIKVNKILVKNKMNKFKECYK